LSSEGFKRVAQIGIVVANIEKTRATWAKLLGVSEPPIIETEGWEGTHMMFNGKVSNARAKLAFFNLENIVVEIIEPIGGPSTWRDSVDKHGNGLHHLGFNISNLGETLQNLSEMGIEVEQKGDYKGGCYVYFDSRGKLGATIEALHKHC